MWNYSCLLLTEVGSDDVFSNFEWQLSVLPTGVGTDIFQTVSSQLVE